MVGHLLAGKHFTVPSGGLDFSGEDALFPQNSVGAAGDVFLYEVGNPYNQNVPGFGDYPFMLEAYDNSTGVTWQWPVDTSQGRFTTRVLEPVDGESREWTLSISNPTLNVEPLTYTPSGDNATIQLIANPDYVIANLTTFIDHTNDGNLSNGTLQPVDFRLIPYSAFDDSRNINISASQTCDVGVTQNCWDNGTISVELSVGKWIFETDAKDARDENTTDFNTLLSNTGGLIDVSIGSEGLDVELGFLPEWHTSITLRNESGGVMSNWSVFFEEAGDGTESFYLDTDENGTIVEYLPEGDWIAHVIDFIDDDGDDTNDDPLQTFRSTLTIDASTPGTDIEWQTVEAAQFNLTLVEAGSGELLSGFTVTAISEDGLGEFTLGPSDESGVIDSTLMPGSWTLSLNRTDSNLRWILDNVTMNFVSGSGNANTNLTLNKWVEIAGNLFRDINNDDAWSYAEGIEGANVTVSSPTFGPVELTSEILGTWRVFVPVNDTYDVLATKDGYSNGSASIQVDYTANTSDIEMMAGMVTVGGEISHVLPSEWNLIADEITLALIPTSGLTFAELTPTKVLVNGTWDGTWTADVEPGDWLLYATYDGTEGRFAAMEHVTAAVAEGGQTDAMLSTASVLHVSTKLSLIHI